MVVGAGMKVPVILPDFETNSFLDVEDKLAVPETENTGILLFHWQRRTRLGRQLFAGSNRPQETEENRESQSGDGPERFGQGS